MKVILLKKVKGLGDIDAVKDVAEGYARNFLFPNNLAVQATQSAIQEISSAKKKVAQKSTDDLHQQQSIAGQLDGFEIELSEKGNEKGVLYAAVSAQKICVSLKKAGFNIKPEQVHMKPLKNSGTHPVVIKFGHGLEAEISVLIQTVS